MHKLHLIFWTLWILPVLANPSYGASCSATCKDGPLPAPNCSASGSSVHCQEGECYGFHLSCCFFRDNGRHFCLSSPCGLEIGFLRTEDSAASPWVLIQSSEVPEGGIVYESPYASSSTFGSLMVGAAAENDWAARVPLPGPDGKRSVASTEGFYLVLGSPGDSQVELPSKLIAALRDRAKHSPEGLLAVDLQTGKLLFATDPGLEKIGHELAEEFRVPGVLVADLGDGEAAYAFQPLAAFSEAKARR